MASASLAPFRSRGFRFMWFGALTSGIGSWMENVALAYYVAETTGKPSWSAVVAAAGFIPAAIVGPIGSAMADRLRRRRVLIVTNALSAMIAAILAIWVGSGNATPLGLAMLGFVAGAVFTFGFPSFQTALPDLVPREDLFAAVGLSNAQWNLGRIIGPTLAGLAIAVGGIELALWCNAVSYLSVIFAVSIVKIPDGPGEKRAIFAALGDGVRFARANPEMRRMLTVMAVVIAVGAPFIAFVSQMATNVFGGTSTATSILVTAQGVGAVAAAFTLGSVTKRFGSRRVMAGASVGFAVALVAYGAAPSLWVSVPALAAVGMSYGYAFTSMGGIAQQVAPDAMRGRVLAVNTFMIGLLYPLGTVVQGVIADATSLRAVTIGSGVVLGGFMFVLFTVGRGRAASAQRVQLDAPDGDLAVMSRAAE